MSQTAELITEEDEFDFSSVAEYEPPEWAASRLISMAEWLGYVITENPEAASGYSVVTPDGRKLGGFVAANIIKGWQANPNATLKGAKGSKKPGAKGGGAGKSPEEKAAKDAQTLASAREAADRALAMVRPDILEAKSKGKIDAGSIQSLLDAAKGKMEGVTDPKEIRKIIQGAKDQIAAYKAEATKPPPVSQQLRDTVVKLKSALPSATQLAGTKFDESKIQKVIDEHTKKMERAQSPEEARAAVKEMRTAIAAEKLEQTKKKAEEAKAHKAATAKPAKVPKTASEWADYYSERWYGEEPQQFMAPGQPRNKDGEWTKGGGGNAGGGAQSFKTDAEGKAFIDSHYGGWKAALTPAQEKGMRFYQSPGYELMNGQLRGTSPKAPAADLARASQATKDLKSAIAKAPPLTAQTTVYRGFSANQFGKLTPGQTVTDKGFTSTSLTSTAAGSFTAKGAQAFATIKLPPGTKAAAGSIKELVLPPGSSFKVSSVTQKGKVTHVEMELVL